MDPIVLAAGTALTTAMTTDGWAMVKAAVVNWWQRFRPEEAEQVGMDLDQLRGEALESQQNSAGMEEALANEWRLRLHRLVANNPAVRDELKRLLDEQITPALSESDQQQVKSLVQKTSVIGSGNTTIVAGRDVHQGGLSSPPRS